MNKNNTLDATEPRPADNGPTVELEVAGAGREPLNQTDLVETGSLR